MNSSSSKFFSVLLNKVKTSNLLHVLLLLSDHSLMKLKGQTNASINIEISNVIQIENKVLYSVIYKENIISTLEIICKEISLSI
uniref:Putative ovule protein n=1 Tax=Solanum chacoense TaxID=4108 RepID=A0A0V0H8U8_SOLCH